MRYHLILFIAVIIANLVADVYIYKAIKKRAPQKRRGAMLKSLALVMALSGGLGMTLAVNQVRYLSDGAFVVYMWLLLAFSSLVVLRWIFVIIDLIAKLPCIFKRRRFKPLSYFGMGLSAFLFLTMWWGAFFNRHNIDVKYVDIPVSDLPAEFEGFTIAQISDLHTGTFYHSTSTLRKIVDTINSLDADIVVFTGDIVSRHADELCPFIPELSRVHGRYGQFAVLGNHDYCEYYGDFDDEEMKKADVEKLVRYYGDTAFDLLVDDYRMIRRGDDSIAVIGVGNIGLPPFKEYGNLSAAYPDASDGVVKILLSHDPDHWGRDIADNPANNIALTLSGHTHASQVKIGPISPSMIFHRFWAGLYPDKSAKHYLYVNIGCGTMGIPMRVGANPEITMLRLTAKPD